MTLTRPLVAGVITALVGFGSSFTVVLAGLRAVGADPAQATSGLLAVSVAAGVAALVLGLRSRLPISIAWSTPGAALLISSGVPAGGFPAAVGAFLLCGLLIVVAGLVRPLGRLIAAIPTPLASAMLAGVLLPLCLAPVRALGEVPGLAAPVIVVWALATRFARLWAVPAALVVAVIALAFTGPDLTGADLLPTPVWVAPMFEPLTLLSLGLPLFLVTMASQNIPGMAVLAQYGFRPPLRPILLVTGALTMLAAPFGGHAVNLAAISAALAAGDDAGPRERRWIASVTAGLGLAVLGLGAGLATALILVAPPVLVQAVAGLALIGALASSLTAAVGDVGRREAAVVTFAVTAAGVAFLGIGSAFWGLVAGAAMLLLRPRPTAPTAPTAPPVAATPTTAPGRHRRE
ncbi:benzoate/H(+) symporter BenE family transporter [Nakamurella flavida]|uniref:Benzoate/H(+) symporter BenE family transporter n=1 Tax=Nakamurella flavida TaxID=363630 RepID=A0A939C7R6_9ACTN|nr:benzoate/H(+) symporter BenE family transporter [Nakamurella flavida]MBM9475898.1 benzoate/H(+) symporter BenE family transporter [Nakamurella flavida]MBM9478442.1 benzoate/H(+) symporter BenE family transporter [Nakamurella flavida]MDP9777816.1 benzoate membrane transport protein [Nakamurella flavida]